eukprot:s98_g26.t1
MQQGLLRARAKHGSRCSARACSGPAQRSSEGQNRSATNAKNEAAHEVLRSRGLEFGPECGGIQFRLGRGYGIAATLLVFGSSLYTGDSECLFRWKCQGETMETTHQFTAGAQWAGGLTLAMGGFYQGKGGGKAAAPAAAPAAAEGVPGALKRKLQALGYPELGSVSLDGQAYMKIILWLEEEKIRLYEKIDRAPLRKFDKSWFEAVAKYAKELGVPADGLSEKAINVKLNVLNGLTNLAVHDIYRDQEEANQLQNAVPHQAVTAGPRQRLGELLPALNRILGTFELPQLPQEAMDTDILAGLKCALVRVAPTGAEEPTMDLRKLPLGIDVADPEVRKAVAVLRLLHGLELQQLQVNINTVINELQQLTANPQTDSRLGRVGR